MAKYCTHLCCFGRLSHPQTQGMASRDSRETNQSAQNPHFPKLKHLEVVEIGFEVVPDDFQGISSLQTLIRIWNCEPLEEIPEQIHDFTSLQTLHIYDCPKLKPLPKHIGNLPNLGLIDRSIRECPGAFAEWWEDPTLPDFPIKHVDTQMGCQWKCSAPNYFFCRKYWRAHNRNRNE
uniref:Uncharacterized protein n=1 Tax=Opuntia streptacantha TaxID=393608 RepID=A0A7C9E2Y1_OPUST